MSSSDRGVKWWRENSTDVYYINGLGKNLIHPLSFLFQSYLLSSNSYYFISSNDTIHVSPFLFSCQVCTMASKPPAPLMKKHSQTDLISRLKSRKILGVGGEDDDGEVHRSKVRLHHINIFQRVWLNLSANVQSNGLCISATSSLVRNECIC